VYAKDVLCFDSEISDNFISALASGTFIIIVLMITVKVYLIDKILSKGYSTKKGLEYSR